MTKPAFPSRRRAARPGNRFASRLVAAGATTAVVGATLVAVTAAPAQAGQCSSKTGGSSDWVMWTGKSYTCAYQSASGKKKIGSANTQTWTSSTALGYTKRDSRKDQTGGVSVSYVYYGSSLGSSITYTAFNTEDGSRHWGAAVIWNTADGGTVSSDQYKGDDYDYKTNRFHVSKLSVSGATTTAPGTPTSYTVKVTDPDGGTTPTGSVVLMRQAGDKPDPSTTDCSGKTTHTGTDSGLAKAALASGSASLTVPGLGAGTYQLYAVYTGTTTSSGAALHCASPSNDGITPAQSSTWTLTVAAPTRPSVSLLGDLGTTSTPGAARPAQRAGQPPVATVDRSFVLDGRGGAPARPMACPAGWVPVQVNAASPTRVLPEKLLERSGGKVGIRDGVAPGGTRIDVQVVCRPRTAAALSHGRTVLGTTGDDRLSTHRRNSTVLAGAGDDHVLVRTFGSSAFGFTGADRIVLTASRGSAAGGPGADVLVARTPGRVVLVGGTGRDRLVGSHGRTLINARDGAGGDVVVCRSSANIVLADPGDTTTGPCTVR